MENNHKLSIVDMSGTSYLLTEEQLLCCICLDVFSDPVTLPCGHNFCKTCIVQHLNFNSQRQCPMCKERVDKKHRLGVNTFISEMAVQFRRSAGRPTTPERDVASPGEVSCDVPAGSKWVSVKSCLLLAFSLTCLSFYFAANIHQTVSGLKNPQLFEDEANTRCSDHDQRLQLHCKDEQIPLCQSCVDSSHRFHHMVPLREESEAKKAELEAKIHWMIQERQTKIRELQRSVKLSSDAANREKNDGVQVFTALIQSLEKAKTELIGTIDKKQRLLRSKNHLHLLQSSSYLDAAPPDKDWTEVSICPTMYEGLLRTVRGEMKKLQDAEIKNIQQVDVTLDPDSAHPALVLSDDGKQVHCGDVWKKLPENPKRFEPAINVVGSQSFSCGRFHYDVQVKGKTGWTLGVAKASANRKGEIKLNPENGYWTIHLRNRKDYFALANYPVPLSVTSRPEKVRVFVDYEEGLVSFYDVDAAVLLYSFTGSSFTEKLYPFFNPGTGDSGRNSAPLIISSINTH
uniref:Nuclear factor 7, ovary-like n=1 Tax=Stegastes partitus TaxID=144197 RepID=A0A3B5B1M2_9TELE